MELNEMLESKLTSEEKIKFERDNGRFKLLKNIIILPIIVGIIGIYFESILIVTICILCIILLLILNIFSINKKGKTYENIIVPYVLKEKFQNIQYNNNNKILLEKIEDSKIFLDYDKISCSNYFKILYGKYDIESCKIVTKKMNIEENDGVVDKSLDENFCGIFATVNIPTKFDNEFRVVKNIKEKEQINNVNKAETQLVRMNNIEFDRIYDVYSMNQVSIKRVLSPGVMARILEINKKIGSIISFSIYNNVLYVSIEYNNYMEFKGKGKFYVDEQLAQQNLNVLENLDYFVRYFINITDSSSN